MKQEDTRIIRSERIKLPKGTDFSEHCSVVAEVYNCMNSIQRPLYYDPQSSMLDSTPLMQVLKTQDDFSQWKDTIGNWMIDRTLQKNRFDWSTFFSSLKVFFKDPQKFLGRPQPPGYTKREIDGRVQKVIYFDKNTLRVGPSEVRMHVENRYICAQLKKNEIMLPQTFDNYIVKRRQSIGKEVMCAYLKPIGTKRYEFIINYVVEETKPVFCQSYRVAAIDLGEVKLITMVDNIGSKPVTISGGPVKSIIYWFNKRFAKIQESYAKQGFTNPKSGPALERLLMKREARMRNLLHTVAKKVVQWCVDRNIDTIVIGLNPNWKQGGMTARANVRQNHQYFPFRQLIDYIKDKAELKGIHAFTVEEDHTSKCSFLDNEFPEHHDSYVGRRGRAGGLPRGQFRTANGTLSAACVRRKFTHPLGCECSVQYRQKGVSNALRPDYHTRHPISRQVVISIMAC